MILILCLVPWHDFLRVGSARVKKNISLVKKSSFHVYHRSPKNNSNVLSSYFGENILLVPNLCLVPWHDFLDVGSGHVKKKISLVEKSSFNVHHRSPKNQSNISSSYISEKSIDDPNFVSDTLA